MAYFNPVTKLDETVTTTIIKDGNAVQVQANVYRCMGIREDGQGACRLCWTTFDMAKFCAMRGHKESWVQMYGDTGFKRVALRRDPVPQARVQAQVQAPAPSGPSAPPSPPQATEAEVRAMALALGFRLSRIPQKPTEPPAGSELERSDEFEPAF